MTKRRECCVTSAHQMEGKIHSPPAVSTFGILPFWITSRPRTTNFQGWHPCREWTTRELLKNKTRQKTLLQNLPLKLYIGWSWRICHWTSFPHWCSYWKSFKYQILTNYSFLTNWSMTPTLLQLSSWKPWPAQLMKHCNQSLSHPPLWPC